jgi:hypothetical protein
VSKKARLFSRMMSGVYSRTRNILFLLKNTSNYCRARPIVNFGPFTEPCQNLFRAGISGNASYTIKEIAKNTGKSATWRRS